MRKLVSASVNLYTILDENMNKKILMRKLFAHNEQHTSHFIIIEIQKNNAVWWNYYEIMPRGEIIMRWCNEHSTHTWTLDNGQWTYTVIQYRSIKKQERPNTIIMVKSFVGLIGFNYSNLCTHLISPRCNFMSRSRRHVTGGMHLMTS